MSNENLSPAARKTAIKNAISEISNSWLQAESFNQHAKDVIDHICSEYELDKKIIAGMAKLHHKQNISDVRARSESLIEQYEEIFGTDE